MGFCFFANVAVAARRARDAHGAERVLVLDWDVHHGNGTNAIFHDDPSVLFVSIHESPLYPGTGPASDVGLGTGGGLHRQPARAGRDGRRRLPLAGRARRGAADRCVGAGARAHLRGLRRPSRRPAGDLPGDRGRLRGDDGVAAAGVRRGRRTARPRARGRLRPRRAGALDGGADAGAGRRRDPGRGGRAACTRSPRPRATGCRPGGRSAGRRPSRP